jgi:hypothetical protein
VSVQNQKKKRKSVKIEKYTQVIFVIITRISIMEMCILATLMIAGL